MKKSQEELSGPDGARPSHNDTVSGQGERQTIVPRTPNERDESTDSQERTTAGQRHMGKMAHDDLAQGQQDTSKLPEMEKTYDKVVGHDKK